MRGRFQRLEVVAALLASIPFTACDTLPTVVGDAEMLYPEMYSIEGDSVAWDTTGVLTYGGYTMVRHGPETAPTSIDFYEGTAYRGKVDVTWADTAIVSMVVTAASTGDWVEGDGSDGKIVMTSNGEPCPDEPPADPGDGDGGGVEEPGEPDEPICGDGGGNTMMSMSSSMMDDCEEEWSDVQDEMVDLVFAGLFTDGLTQVSKREIFKRATRVVAKRMLPGAYVWIALESATLIESVGRWGICLTQQNLAFEDTGFQLHSYPHIDGRLAFDV